MKQENILFVMVKHIKVSLSDLENIDIHQEDERLHRQELFRSYKFRIVYRSEFLARSDCIQKKKKFKLKTSIKN